MEIRYNEKKTNIEKGLTVSEAFKDEIENSKYEIVGCLYNNEYMNLETEIQEGARIKLIDISSKEGMKIYRRTLVYIMGKAFEIAGYDEEVLKAKFGALYHAFQFGAPPHAGMAPGIDRMIMLLRNEENIREVIAFPMSGTAQDLMCGAPNEVTEQQLREVHIKVRD